MQHAQMMFDYERLGPVGLERALRNMPPGSTIRLVRSGLGLQRVGGGRMFRPVVPPKMTTPTGIKQEDLKSATTAASALAKAHEEYVGEVHPMNAV